VAQFYKELKELRESRKISLEEISDRTKINIQYLQAIESGDFSDIETPYLRLFLRLMLKKLVETHNDLWNNWIRTLVPVGHQ